MYTGKLWLNFDDGDEEASYTASISRCIFREREIVFEFAGKDEGHFFTGTCSLAKFEETYSGKGTFAYEGESPTNAIVTVKVYATEREIGFRGNWTDEGDTQAYELEVELINDLT
jgi:hypothetical protein